MGGERHRQLLLRIFGFRPEAGAHSPLSKEELRTVVAEAGAMIPERYQNMLLGILDLETATVEDIMVPRNQIVGIDLEDSIEAIQAQIVASRYTRLPVYQKSIDKVTGILHLRKALIAMKQGAFDKGMLKKQTEAVTFVPENTPLHRLLINFRRDNRRIGLVVDEYGDVRGLVTLSDLLEEIIGEFTTDPQDIQKQRDGSFLVHAGVTVRELNRVAGYSLPTEGPKTLNGLIIEYLETIPAPGVSSSCSDIRWKSPIWKATPLSKCGYRRPWRPDKPARPPKRTRRPPFLYTWTLADSRRQTKNRDEAEHTKAS